MIYFRKNLLYLRAKKSMTLNQIANEIGFTASQWNNYELGNSFPKFLDLIKISKYFNISETDLIHIDLQSIGMFEINSGLENQEDINLLQNKLIKMQEEKINRLEMEIQQLKNVKI